MKLLHTGRKSSVTCQIIFIGYSFVMIEPAPIPASLTEPAFLLADHTALDFLNSVASPEGEPMDWIADGQRLMRWLRQSELLSPSEIGLAQRRFDDHDLDGVAEEARALRFWLGAAVHMRKRGEEVSPLGPLESILAHDWSRPVLSHRSWSCERDFRSPTALLGPIAKAIGDLLIAADFARVRPCEGASCTLWFLDVSKTNRRRWCNMAICGNRAKVAAHRARARLRARS